MTELFPLEPSLSLPLTSPTFLLMGSTDATTTACQNLAREKKGIFLTTLDLSIRPHTFYIFENIDSFFQKSISPLTSVFDTPKPSGTEIQFFAFWDHLIALNSQLLLSAQKNPREWGLVLDDLISRFKLVPIRFV